MPTVRELMTEDVMTCGPKESLARVYTAMIDGRFRHMPIVQDGELMGIVSDTDIAAVLGRYQRGDVMSRIDRLEDVTVGRVMITAVETIGPDEDAVTAAETMLEGKISCLPVVEGTRLVGILTEADFVRWVATASPTY